MEEVFCAALARGLYVSEIGSAALSLLQSGGESSRLGRQLLEDAGDLDVRSLINYAMCLQVGDGGSVDYAQARKVCLAVLGQPDISQVVEGSACAILADQASEGRATAKNLREARTWWERGASRGSGDCAFRLGLYWDETHRMEGVEDAPEPRHAARYYRQAILAGSPFAALDLGLLLAHHPECANSSEEWRQMIRLAADNGDDQAALVLQQIAASKGTKRRKR